MPKWVKAEKNSINNGIDIDIRFKDGGCPQGTVPIKRNDEHDFFQTKLLQQRYAQLGANHSYTTNDGDKVYVSFLAYLTFRKFSR